VDLNPIRARIAETPETSRFTSVYERIQALVTQPGAGAAAPRHPPCEGRAVSACSDEESGRSAAEPMSPETRANWLSPFELLETAADAPIPSARASNKGCLPMSFAESLNPLDWAGRQLREDKRGAIPHDLAPILERLHIGGEGWMQLIGQFRRLFRRAAGRPQSLQREREQRGCRLMQGIRHSRALFF